MEVSSLYSEMVPLHALLCGVQVALWRMNITVHPTIRLYLVAKLEMQPEIRIIYDKSQRVHVYPYST
jgi:hypothetical protein